MLDQEIFTLEQIEIVKFNPSDVLEKRIFPAVTILITIGGKGEFRVGIAKDAEVAHIVLAWYLAVDAIDALIPGAKKPEQVMNTLKTLDVRLTAEEIEKISHIFQGKFCYIQKTRSCCRGTSSFWFSHPQPLYFPRPNSASILEAFEDSPIRQYAMRLIKIQRDT
ncbi:MAG: oxidoreductase [Brevibacillus sp.]|nr:oxidoreductase [Brevibacillus sp.]